MGAIVLALALFMIVLFMTWFYSGRLSCILVDLVLFSRR
jgi:hypothetical protein